MNKEQRAEAIKRMLDNAHSASEREYAELLDSLNQLLSHAQPINRPATSDGDTTTPIQPVVKKRIGRPPGKGVTSGIKKPKTSAATG